MVVVTLCCEKVSSSNGMHEIIMSQCLVMQLLDQSIGPLQDLEPRAKTYI